MQDRVAVHLECRLKNKILYCECNHTFVGNYFPAMPILPVMYGIRLLRLGCYCLVLLVLGCGGGGGSETSSSSISPSSPSNPDPQELDPQQLDPQQLDPQQLEIQALGLISLAIKSGMKLLSGKFSIYLHLVVMLLTCKLLNGRICRLSLQSLRY